MNCCGVLSMVTARPSASCWPPTVDDVVVEYALRNFETPLAVSTYTTHRALPEEVRPALPSPDELADVIRDVRRHHTQET